jgi:hypothetical protein
MLESPDRRSIGRANEAAQAITDGYCDHRHAIALLYDEDALIRMRAADALEKATVQDASAITPFRKQLVDLLCQTEQKDTTTHYPSSALSRTRDHYASAPPLPRTISGGLAPSPHARRLAVRALSARRQQVADPRRLDRL